MRLSQVVISGDNNSDGLGVGATKLFRIPVENNTLTGKTSQETNSTWVLEKVNRQLMEQEA